MLSVDFRDCNKDAVPEQNQDLPSFILLYTTNLWLYHSSQDKMERSLLQKWLLKKTVRSTKLHRTRAQVLRFRLLFSACVPPSNHKNTFSVLAVIRNYFFLRSLHSFPSVWVCFKLGLWVILHDFEDVFPSLNSNQQNSPQQMLQACSPSEDSNMYLSYLQTYKFQILFLNEHWYTEKSHGYLEECLSVWDKDLSWASELT